MTRDEMFKTISTAIVAGFEDAKRDHAECVERAKRKMGMNGHNLTPNDDYDPMAMTEGALRAMLPPPEKRLKRDEVSQGVEVPDPEVEALRATCAALEALQDPAARRRVLLWAQARFGSEVQWTPPASPERSRGASARV